LDEIKGRREIDFMNIYERGILQILQNAKRSLSINEIATFAKISWSTAKKHIDTLERKGKVKKEHGKYKI
jgi:DNA-binding Lrp family transcriptional regulator